MSGFTNDVETDGIPTPSKKMASSWVSGTWVSRESVIMEDSEPQLEGVEPQISTPEQTEESLSKFLLVRLFRCAPLIFNR